MRCPHHKGTGMFLDSAVSSPLDRSERLTLFLPWQTCSFRHQLDFSGKHSSHAAIMREDYSFTFPQPSIDRHSLIQLSGVRCLGENENARAEKQQQMAFKIELSGLRVKRGEEAIKMLIKISQSAQS